MNWNDHSEFIFNVLHRMGAKIDDLCGRKVLLLPITEWGYAPIDSNDLQPHQDWVLVVEETGDTWIWDSWILEG